MPISEDRAAFLADFGVTARFNDLEALVLLDQQDNSVLGDRAQSTEYSITFVHTDLPGLKHGSWITVDDVPYEVVTVSSIDDGKFRRAVLQKT